MTAAPSRRGSDEIAIRGIRVFGRHGVLPEERRDGQTFVVDVVLAVDTRPAARSDDLRDTVDYGAVATRVAAIVAGDPVDLLETLAARVADDVLAASDDAGTGARVERVVVTVHKPSAPIPVPFDDVSVTIVRDRPADADADADADVDVDVDAGSVRPPSAPAAAPVEAALASAPPASAPPASSPPASAPASLPEPVEAVVAFGANLGDRAAVFEAAVAELRRLPLTDHVRASEPVESVALTLDGPDESAPAYLNAVVTLRTSLTSRTLLDLLHAIEARHGRERRERWGPRTLDLDLIAYGDVVSDDPDLTLPHPRAAERDFVLRPWLALDPGATLPGVGRVDALLAALEPRP